MYALDNKKISSATRISFTERVLSIADPFVEESSMKSLNCTGGYIQ
jgi:hypothetical protein